MLATLSSSTLSFASTPVLETCPDTVLDFLASSDAKKDFFTTLMHMRDPFTPAAEVMAQVMTNFKPIGSHSALLAEAGDILYADPPIAIEDGKSGDTDFPFGNLKALCTVGEYLPGTGYMLVGVPDGMGAMLKDDTTVRIVFQSESYGTLAGFESYPFIVNPDQGGGSFTGSHVMYVDYDRDKLADFMNNGDTAEGMVKDAGNMIETLYNLKGNLVQKREESGCTEHPHYSNTDENGCGEWSAIMRDEKPTDADWVMQSLCAAHLEEKHQWGSGLGVEDDLFITNEEWTTFNTGANYTGIPAHVIDLATKTSWATGVFTLGGFEKIVEVNCGHPDYVCFSPSGYNGAFNVDGSTEAVRKNALGSRPDGTPYVYPQNVCPARLYIGKKGYNAQGEPANDFLSRNGLAYGHLYGFATSDADAKESRDGWHKTDGRANGDAVSGSFMPLDWQWDGGVSNFLHDGSWAFQHIPADGYQFWNANGNDDSGSKTEHNSPDPYGGYRFIQTSTAGYFGIYDFSGIADLLADGFPSEIPAEYTNLQGEVDITAQIELGGKGMKANGEPQTTMSDSYSVQSDGTIYDSAKVTFEDIDGFEWLASSDSPHGYVVIQEDGGNDFGERTFISKVEVGTPMTYYFIAMSGGDDNTRIKNYVAVPAGSAGYPTSHEFSGVIDLSGMLATDSSGNYLASAGDGHAKRLAEAAVPIDEKIIAMGLQGHSVNAGVIEALRGDRGGQVYAYTPSADVKNGRRRLSTKTATKASALKDKLAKRKLQAKPAKKVDKDEHEWMNTPHRPRKSQ